ncbi:TMC domain protein [Aphelenchoides fujianensis]|nr:TMC domain protein [Aphelenchoides fujianensis]
MGGAGKKEAKNVLHLIKDQTMVWLGTLFVPFPAGDQHPQTGRPDTCNIPARQIFRASRSNNFYLILLLLMFLFSTIPVGYVIASIPPSKGCGPFAGQPHFYTVIIQSLKNTLNGKLVGFIEGIMSPGLIIPILLFLLLVIYFMFALIRGLHDANHELEEQLTMERTEEKRRIFELAGGGRKRHQAGTNGVQIPKASPEKGGKVNSSPQRSLKTGRLPPPLAVQIADQPAGGQPLVPPLFAEDDDNAEDEEEETREPQPTDQLLRRESSPSTVQHRPEVRYDELPPVKMNWKQRLLVLIGVLDRDKVEAKLRMRQLAEVAYANDREDDEEEQKERKRSLPLKHHTTTKKKTRLLPPCRTRSSKRRLLRPTASSPSRRAARRASSGTSPLECALRWSGRRPAGRPPEVRGRVGGRAGRAARTRTPGPAELLTIINTGQPPSRMGSATPHRSTPPVQPQRAPSQRRAQRAGTTASSSPWLEGEQPRRSFSMNNPRHLQPPLERDLVSESSPLMERRSADVLESHRLSPEKRSPPSAPMRKRSSGSGIREFSLDPTPMVYDGNYWDHPHKSNRMQLSDEATRPPSEETSFRDPTPSRSEDAQRQVQSPYSDFQDDRLAYANPYSSYAAAMASPLMPDNLENDPFVQRLRQTSALSATPEPPNFRAVPVDPFAAYNAPPLQNPQPYYMTPMTPLTPTFSPVRPRNAARFSSLQPPTPQLQSARAAPQQFFAPPFVGPDAYVTPAPATYSPYRSPQQRTPLPIYPSGYGTEPRFSSDPRNTSPSGGYQSGNSPTPDIGSPRFRISTSPPRRMRPTYLSEEADSGRGSGNQSDPSVRRWDLRQRGTITSTDDSTSPERSPSRQPHG